MRSNRAEKHPPGRTKPISGIKEANPPEFRGTATGVCNFINFTFSALMGQVFGWILVRVSHGSGHFLLKDYRITFKPLIFGVGLAIFLTLFLTETGHAVIKKQ